MGFESDTIAPWFGPGAHVIPTVSLGKIPIGGDHSAQDKFATVLERAWKHYEGTNSPPLNPGPAGEDDNVRLNLCRYLVNTFRYFTLGKSVKVRVADDADGSKTDRLCELWPERSMMTALGKTATNGAITGHHYLRNIEPVRPGDCPRVIVLDGAMVRVITDPNDYEKVSAYVLTWQVYDERNRRIQHRQTIRRDETSAGLTVGWNIVDEVRQSDAETWQVVGGATWPYELAPIVDAQFTQSSGYWGTPLLTVDRIELADDIERNLTNAAKIIRLHSSPWAITKQLDDDTADAVESAGPDSMIHLRDGEQSIELLEFQGSGFARAMELDERLIARWHKVVGLPNEESRPGTIGEVSGVASQMRYIPTTQAVEDIRSGLHALIEREAQVLFMLAGDADYADVEVEIEWPPILPDDQMGKITQAAALIEVGASHETAFAVMGLDWHDEAERRAAEAQLAQAEAAESPEETAAEGADPDDEGATEAPANESDADKDAGK